MKKSGSYLILVVVSLSLISFLIPSRLCADDTWKLESRRKFLEFTAGLSGDDYRRLVIELVTVSPGITVTSEFGHSALRIRLGRAFEDRDFFVDFGQYEMSGAFMWSLFRGRARFFVHALPMASAYQESDSTARGLYVSEFSFNPEQKKKMIAFVRQSILENPEGYEYNNFSSNCVTFIRDGVAEAIGRPLDLELADPSKNTGRDLSRPFSNNNNWLRIDERLLFDHDTDKPRYGMDRIFLPYNLLAAVEQAGLVKPRRELLPNRLPPSGEGDLSGELFLVLMALIAISAIPLAVLKRFRRKGEVLFGLISGLAGLNVTIVWFLTIFDFMDENLMPLVFTPFDFILLRNPLKFGNPRLLLYYGLLRLLMLAAALVLMLTVYHQKILLPLTWSAVYLGLYTWNRWKG